MHEAEFLLVGNEQLKPPPSMSLHGVEFGVITYCNHSLPFALLALYIRGRFLCHGRKEEIRT